MPTTSPSTTPPRATRPLYLKRVPTPVWERVHVNAIRSGMRLTDYLVTILASAEPIGPTDPEESIPGQRSPTPPDDSSSGNRDG
jgi:hypothetical protein